MEAFQGYFGRWRSLSKYYSIYRTWKTYEKSPYTFNAFTVERVLRDSAPSCKMQEIAIFSFHIHILERSPQTLSSENGFSKT